MDEKEFRQRIMRIRALMKQEYSAALRFFRVPAGRRVGVTVVRAFETASASVRHELLELGKSNLSQAQRQSFKRINEESAQVVKKALNKPIMTPKPKVIRRPQRVRLR